jgi:uncharacterized membrane protein YedE/YeeE
VNLLLTAFVSGLVFAIGLGISGMTQPAKVTAFLDFAGDWDPSLALVMVGAIAVYAPLYRLIHRLPSPVFSATFALPTRTDIDRRLVGGAALFGVGWGLGGFCPGPALTSLAAGEPSVLLFVASMLTGMYVYKLGENSGARRATASHQAPASA